MRFHFDPTGKADDPDAEPRGADRAIRRLQRETDKLRLENRLMSEELQQYQEQFGPLPHGNHIWLG